MVQPVPNDSVMMIGAACMAGILIPVALFIYFKLKKKAHALPFFLGCLVFFLFVMILESGINAAVFSSGAGAVLRNNVILYALYGGIMAAVFEEVGRYLFLKIVRRRRGLRDVNALMYGAGHGGFEVLMVLGVTMFGNLSYAAAVNSGQIEQLMSQLSGESLAQFTETLNILASTPPYTYLLSIAERLFAVCIQISLSVLVWFAVTREGKGWFFPLAIGIHFAVDFVTALCTGFGLPAVATEVVVALMAVIVSLFAYKVWNNEHIEETPADPGQMRGTAAPRLSRR